MADFCAGSSAKVVIRKELHSRAGEHACLQHLSSNQLSPSSEPMVLPRLFLSVHSHPYSFFASQVQMVLILCVFALVHSGGAALRSSAEKVIGERAYRVLFAGLSLPLAVSSVVSLSPCADIHT